MTIPIDLQKPLLEDAHIGRSAMDGADPHVTTSAYLTPCAGYGHVFVVGCRILAYCSRL